MSQIAIHAIHAIVVPIYGLYLVYTIVSIPASESITRRVWSIDLPIHVSPLTIPLPAVVYVKDCKKLEEVKVTTREGQYHPCADVVLGPYRKLGSDMPIVLIVRQDTPGIIPRYHSPRHSHVNQRLTVMGR